MATFYSNIKRKAQRKIINQLYGISDRDKLSKQIFDWLMIFLRTNSYRYKDDYLSDKVR